MPAAASPLQAGTDRTTVTVQWCSALHHLWGSEQEVVGACPAATCPLQAGAHRAAVGRLQASLDWKRCTSE